MGCNTTVLREGSPSLFSSILSTESSEVQFSQKMADQASKSRTEEQ